MEILFTIAGFRSGGQHSGKCPLFASLRGLHWALFLMDGSFNVTTEKKPHSFRCGPGYNKTATSRALHLPPPLSLCFTRFFFCLISSPPFHSSPYSWSKTDICKQLQVTVQAVRFFSNGLWITGCGRGVGIGMEERSTKGGAAFPFAAGLKAFSSCPLWVLTQRDLWWGWSLTPLRPHYVN